jgi:peptidoglycan lytic transglycosylase
MTSQVSRLKDQNIVAITRGQTRDASHQNRSGNHSRDRLRRARSAIRSICCIRARNREHAAEFATVTGHNKNAPRRFFRQRTKQNGRPMPSRAELIGALKLIGPGQAVTGCPLPHSLLILLCFFALASEARAEAGLASYYSYGNRGERGEMTCAHRTRSFGSIVTVTYSGRSIQCRIADRGPFIRGRIIDLSVKAARALGMMDAGVVRVSVE